MAEAAPIMAVQPSPKAIQPHAPTLKPLELPTSAAVDDKLAPAVASPSKPSTTAITRVREERAKKPTAKAKKDSPEPSSVSKKAQHASNPSTLQATGQGKAADVLRPSRYKLPPPKAMDFASPFPPTFVPTHRRVNLATASSSSSQFASPASTTGASAQPATDIADNEYFEASEIINNRKGFRYTSAIADPQFPSIQYNRQSECAPYRARISWEDASSQLQYNYRHDIVTTDRGFRMARANTGVREGKWYWEMRVISGIAAAANPPDTAALSSDPARPSSGHVRIGCARREASLEGPVGFDAYSYGLRDVGGQTVTRSRPEDFAHTDLCEGDVIGFEITLPPLALHRKVVAGTYNKAVDGVWIDGATGPDHSRSAYEEGDCVDIIRDRVIYRYRNRLYFEAFEYQYTKPLEDYLHPAPPPAAATTAAATAAAAAMTDPPNPNHPVPQLRTLPGSSIRVYRNGMALGPAFTDLLAFLPPASKPNTQFGAREGLDDGLLGYYPAVSVYRGGAVKANFGPSFEFPPAELGMGTVPLRPLSERFDEQIAEDIVYDIVDEVDFWALDGANGTGQMAGLSETAPASFAPREVESSVPLVMEGRKPAAAPVSSLVSAHPGMESDLP